MVNRSRRSGYTLFELILVGAVIVILGGICYPSLKNMYGSHKQNGAVDSVRSAWAEARAHSINEGRPYRFSIEPNGSHYRIAPDNSDYWPGSGSANDPQGKGKVVEGALPGGVRFSLGDDKAAPPPASADSDKDDKPASGHWATGVVFLPDGTAKDDVKITFQVRGVRSTSILLRGLTGNVSTVH